MRTSETPVPGATAPAARDDSGRWRTLGLLSMALILSMTTWFSASAVIPQLREEWALSTGAAAWLTIAVQIGFVAGALTSALLNLPDVVAPRHVILGGAAGAAAANLVVAWSGGVGAALPLRFLTGFFLAGVYPPALKLLSTWFVRGRGTALGILVGANTVGTAGPHLVNGLGGLDWRVVIFVTSALTLAGGLLVEAAVAEGLIRSRGPSSTRARPARFWSTGECGSPPSVTWVTCGSSTPCGPGSWSSSRSR
jgi:MFS family permease